MLDDRSKSGMNIFSEAIVEWYKEYKRDLPWRESSDRIGSGYRRLFSSRHGWRRDMITSPFIKRFS